MPIEQDLSPQELDFLNGAVKNGQITRLVLPTGISIGLDSMGPVRDSKTDALYPGMKEVLYSFKDTLREYDLTLVVATNGPDIEGVDILEAVDPNHQDPIRAWAVTEGGGRLIIRSREHTGWEYTNLADEREVSSLNDIVERASARSKLMNVLLSDTESDGKDVSIRTPYFSNVVLTLPNTFETLRARFVARGVDLETEMPDINSQNYLDEMLGYINVQLHGVIADSMLSGTLSQLTKRQNRRHYVTPSHLFDGEDFSKIGGAMLGARLLYSVLGKELRVTGYDKEYQIGNSIYIADKAVDVTGEGQTVLGSSEKSMIAGLTYFWGAPEPGINVIKVHERISPFHREDNKVVEDKGDPMIFAEVGTRLTIHVTMDKALPALTTVEGVPVLNIGSGAKALEALTYLYQKLHG